MQELNITIVYNIHNNTHNNKTNDIQYHGAIFVNNMQYVKHFHLYNSNYNNLIENATEIALNYYNISKKEVSNIYYNDILIGVDNNK